MCLHNQKKFYFMDVCILNLIHIAFVRNSFDVVTSFKRFQGFSFNLCIGIDDISKFHWYMVRKRWKLLWEKIFHLILHAWNILSIKARLNFLKAVTLVRPSKYERLCSKADIDIANLHSLHLWRINSKLYLLTLN